MKRFFAFIAGNSRVTPIGIAVAFGACAALRHSLGARSLAVYLALLLCTLAAAVAEPVQ